MCSLKSLRLVFLLSYVTLAIAAEASESEESYIPREWPRNALQQFDLKSLKLYRVDRIKCCVRAEVIDPNGYIHLIQYGSYMGRHNGIVVNITKNRIHLRELYRKPDGEWEERDAFLEREKE